MDGGLLPIGAATALLLALPVVALRRGGRAFVACLSSLALALLLAEGLLRILGAGVPGRAEWLEPLRLGSPAESAYWPGGELVYSYPSDPRGTFDAAGRVVGQVNSLGLRGTECDLAPTPGRTRVAVLGDSFTLGIGVRDADTLPAQLEAALGPQRSEVLNFGVSATDTLQQVQYLEGYVLRFDPRVVVLVFFLNDTERSSTMRYLTEPRALVGLRRHSHLLELLVASLERPLLRGPMEAHYREGYSEKSEPWRAVREALLHARDLLAQRGIAFAVAIHPVLIDLAPDDYPFEDIHATVRAFCEDAGIPVVDLHAALAGERAADLWVHPNDRHPNERANRLSAAHLAAFLQREGLVR
jgi:lysophospholipase L1-like esterase